MNQKWFIYVLRDPISWDVRYVGKSNNPEQRFKGHLRPRARVKHWNAQWVRSLTDKGTKPLLEVIDVGFGDGHAAAERAWIKYFRQQRARLTNTGDGGLGFCNTPETRAKIARSLTGRVQSEATKLKRSLAGMGRKHSPASIEKMSLSQKGKPRPPESIAKMAATKRGKPLPASTRQKLMAYLVGHTVSQETRERISATNTGKACGEDTKRKIADTLTGRKTPDDVKVKLRAAQQERRAKEKAARGG